LQVAYECLMHAIAAVRPGTRYRDLGDVITRHAHKHGCSVVRTYCGHGICDLFHCRPNVPHYAKNKAKGIMEVRHGDVALRADAVLACALLFQTWSPVLGGFAVR
jgi:methionyl aminopeptidase